MRSTIIRLTIDHRRIAWLKFVLESYEGLAFMRTLDPVSGCVELYGAPGAEAELGALLRSLIDGLGFVEGLSDELPVSSRNMLSEPEMISMRRYST